MIRKNIFSLSRHKLNYFLVFMVLTFATDPFFNGSKFAEVFQISLLGFFFIRYDHSLDRKILLISLVIASLIMLQGLFWDFAFVAFITYLPSFILVPYFLYRLIGTRVFHYFVNIIYFFSITSLIFWLFQNVLPPFDFFLQDIKNVAFEYSTDRWPRSIVFYTVAISKADLSLFDVYRNSGIFHEPGAYALWLIFAIGINTILTGKHFDKKSLIFVIALLTTFSTAGYIQLFVLLLFLVSKSKINLAFKVIVFLMFIVISAYSYVNLNFLASKVETHIDMQTGVQLEGAFTTGRIVRARKIKNVIQQSPIIGRGIITASAEHNKYSRYYVSGTGSLKMIAHYGIIFGFLFFLYFYRGILRLISINNYYKSFGLFFFASMFVGGLSQDFYYDAISIQFFLIGLYQSKHIVYLKSANKVRLNVQKT